MERIFTPEAPSPGGHYSQAVVHHDLIFVSGQLPIRPHTGEKVLGPIEEQAGVAIQNVVEIVLAAGGDLSTILKTTVYIADIELWSRVNQVYAGIFGDHTPARAIVPIKTLHHGFLIEIEAVAAKKASSR